MLRVKYSLIYTVSVGTCYKIKTDKQINIIKNSTMYQRFFY